VPPEVFAKAAGGTCGDHSPEQGEMTMTKQIRFWFYGDNGPVLIKIKAGQTLFYSRGGPTDEGWYRDENFWEFDGETLVNMWCSDGCDCDGRLTRRGISYCPAMDVRRGHRTPDDGITYPRWVEGKSSQRDYSAEAMGY
jgi:hypothetical protein